LDLLTIVCGSKKEEERIVERRDKIDSEKNEERKEHTKLMSK
jgi:hypothetical protein